MYKQKLFDEIISQIEAVNDDCKPLVGNLIKLAELQASEMDRFWKAIDMHDADISIDDAIRTVTLWKNEYKNKDKK